MLYSSQTPTIAGYYFVRFFDDRNSYARPDGWVEAIRYVYIINGVANIEGTLVVRPISETHWEQFAGPITEPER